MSNLGCNIGTLRREIESLFDYVCPYVGVIGISPTTEPYVTYALGSDVDDEFNRSFLCASLFATFVTLRSGCSPMKPEGTPTCICNPAKTEWWRGYSLNLYWRKFPEFVVAEDAVVYIRCTALVTSIRTA